VPVAKPLNVPVVPVPVMVEPPGVAVMVQVPDAVSPLKATLPVAIVQVGWVMAPTTGAAGVAGCVLMVALSDEVEVQPAALVTVKV
jgi:hypothetical protein